MERHFTHNSLKVHASLRGGARLALCFSLLACVISVVALMVAMNQGRLPQKDLFGRYRGAPPSENAPAPAEADPRATSRVDKTGAAPAEWDQVRERLKRAETMIAQRDGRVPEYLDKLKADMERLMHNSSEGGGKWMGDAVAKIKAIREQVAVNGPEAGRRLRELSSDLGEKVRTLYRAAEALQSMMPKKKTDSAAGTGTEVEAAPEVPER